MARYDCAIWHPLPENQTEPWRDRTWKLLIFHSQVGNYDLWNYFNSPGVVLESQFWVPKNGKSEQFLDTLRTADANFKANPGGISVETADNGNPDTDPWNALQLEALAQIAAEAHIKDGVPLRMARHWQDDGIGYHSLFPEWSPVAKTCPGRIRIKQIPGIIARAKEIVEGDVALTDAEITAIAKEVWRYDQAGAAEQAWSYQKFAAAKVWDDAHANAVFAHLNAIRADLDELQATVAGLQGSAVSGAPTAAENALAVLAALRANPLAPK